MMAQSTRTVARELHIIKVSIYSAQKSQLRLKKIATHLSGARFVRKTELDMAPFRSAN
jgi:hypothetical protein